MPEGCRWSTEHVRTSGPDREVDPEEGPEGGDGPQLRLLNGVLEALLDRLQKTELVGRQGHRQGLTDCLHTFAS